MSKEVMKIWFYPVGNGDSSLIRNDDGKYMMIDYNCPKDAESDDDERINLKEELDDRLKGSDLEILMITHSHEDHYKGFSEYFWLNFASTYQSEDRKKIGELWIPDAFIWETGITGEGKTLRQEARHRLLNEKAGIKVFGESQSLKDYPNVA